MNDVCKASGHGAKITNTDELNSDSFVPKRFSVLFVLTDNSRFFYSSAYQTRTTAADLRRYNSHSQWSIITASKTRAGRNKKNKHNISGVCEDCMALCKNCAIIPPPPPPSLPQKIKTKRINMSIFSNFRPISCCSLAFHFTLCFSLFIDETEGGRRPLLTGTNLSVCVSVHVCHGFTLCFVSSQAMISVK